MWLPSDIMIHWAHTSPSPNGISIGSAVFAEPTGVRGPWTEHFGLNALRLGISVLVVGPNWPGAWVNFPSDREQWRRQVNGKTNFFLVREC